MIVSKYIQQAPTRMLLSWSNLPSSVYYYKSTGGKPGVKASSHTWKQDGEWVDNQVVIEQIKDILSQEFCCYGYENISIELRKLDYCINKKKVYRLMDEQNLLLGKVISTSGKRKFVQHRKIEASYPMEYLCLDIKYVYVHGEKKNFYLLTIIDVFTRKIVDQVLQKSIKQIDVINAFRCINNDYGIKGVTIRNDNGPQFIANSVKQYLRTAEANQEFTHIATPEENSYIEAFHSIVQREVIERYEFTGFYDAKQTLLAHKIWYNSRRFHKAIKMTPNEKWEQNIYITNQKRIERNLSENLGKITSDLNQDYQYLSQNLNEKKAIITQPFQQMCPLIRGWYSLARIDIFVKHGNKFQLIEVKSASRDSLNPKKDSTKLNKYIQDISFQYTILKDVFPDCEITCLLLMPDKSMRTLIDGLAGWFRLIYKSILHEEENEPPHEIITKTTSKFQKPEEVEFVFENHPNRQD